MASKRSKKRRYAELTAKKQQLAGGIGTLSQQGSFADHILRRVGAISIANPVPPKLEMPTPKPITPVQQVVSTITPSELPPVIVQEESELVKKSHEQKEVISKQALENQQYYLQQQSKDKEPRPWFMYPKFSYQYSEFVMISPRMAQTTIEHLWSKEEGNRNLKPTLVDAYVRDINNNRWLYSVL